MQFFISHLASWLRTRRFSEPTFRPSGAPNHWKNTVLRDFPTFSRICIFFLLTLLSSNLSLLFASSLLCFSSVHIAGSLTSKLPSISNLYVVYMLFICDFHNGIQTTCSLPKTKRSFYAVLSTAYKQHTSSTRTRWGGSCHKERERERDIYIYI